MPVVENERARITYEDTGGGGAVVVFSHGILMDREMFEPQIEALRSEFRCISWDQRGHGTTQYEGAFSYWDSAGDLIAILDDAAVDHAFLAGMSQGGFVSMRAALNAPDRVRGLAFIDSQAGQEDPAQLPIYEAMMAQWLAEGPSPTLLQAVAVAIVEPADSGPWIAKWAARGATDRQSVVDSFNALAGREDLHDRLAEITCPALVIHGDTDPSISMELAERLCEGMVGCEGIVRVAGGGHASNLSHPGIVTEALRDFFRRHAG